MGSEKAAAMIAFASAREADRRVAGVAAAARAVRARAEAGETRIRLGLGEGALAPATLADIERLRGGAEVALAPDRSGAAGFCPPSSWEIVRQTGKPGDGLVSRWLNRPISQRISWLLLQIPGVRPIHVTAFNAVLALAIFPLLVKGGEAGLIAGAVLFQAASVLDGVDGEMARATWRSSPAGATLDSVVDIATNLLFVTGLTINLALRDGDAIGWIGAWAVALSISGGLLLGLRARAGGGPVGFDQLKRRERRRGFVGFVYWLVQVLTGRDCFAFLFMALTLAGLERVALMIYAGVGTIWFSYVLGSLFLLPRASRREA
ncbi:MAG TPA: CDP-alcohol phosphatidyltransferase family protein [Allosphingosinicella sp.]|nr:CDP-alcohol phosphatidyltransferase family protein [Allosphingosinicella sp.]